MTPSKKRTLAIVGVICAAGLIRGLNAPVGTPPKDAAAAGPTTFGFAGSSSCSARGCHGRDRPVEDSDAVSLQNEYTHGLLYDKHTQAYAVLRGKRADTIASNLALRSGKAKVEAHQDWRCLACHATPQSAWEQAHGKQADTMIANWQLGGVSCEACHGPSKTQKPWLEVHTSRKEWRDKLKPADKEAYGFRNLADFSTQAQVCAGCHVGAPPDEKNKIPKRDCNHDIMAAGHPRLNFELSVFRANMPPHWKMKEEEDNAKIWLHGRVGSAKAALELLKYRADESKANKDARWPEFAEYRCYACHRDLNTDWRSVKNEKGRSIGSFPYDSWYGSLLPDLDRKVGEGYGKLTSLMAKPTPDTDEVRKTAGELIKNLDALKELKTADLLPDITKQIKTMPRSWEDGMQLTLALAALNQKRIPESLRELAKALAFPPGGEGPKGIEFPKALEAAQKAYDEYLKMK